jgi:hypothetical protein
MTADTAAPPSPWAPLRIGVFRVLWLAVPDQMVEVYVVPTWDEHLRQHGGRTTGADVELDRQVKALSELPPQVAHLLPTDGVR